MAKKASVKLRFFATEFLDALDDEVKGIITRARNRYVRIVQDMHRAPKTGRIYNIGKTPTKGDAAAKRTFRSHQASAPGEAPAVMYGRLRQSIVSDIQRLFPSVWEAVVGTSIKPEAGQDRSYPQILEEGSTNIEPRPMWRPALEQLRSEADEIVKGK